MRRGFWLLVSAACVGTAHIDPAKFTPDPAWSYVLAAEPAPPPAHGAGASPATRLSRDQMIEDVGYLMHAIDGAWAWRSRATIDSFRALPDYLRDVPLHAVDAAGECAQLAQALRNTGIQSSLAGVPCRAVPPASAGLGSLDTVPADRNFHLRIDRAEDDAVGILTITRFADVTDPGWAGFATAMHELATLELVIVDVQSAAGEDPRAGFGVLAALGLDDLSHAWLGPSQFRDTELAQIVRHNAQRLVPAPAAPRDRVLWSSFPTDADVKRIAHELVPGVERRTKPVAVELLVGAGCASACQMMLWLAREQRGVKLFGTVDNRLSGDELGAIRLPHSGIIVTFPTASYGPYVIGELESSSPPRPDLAVTQVAKMHQIGHERAESIAWRTRPLPDCRELPVDLKLLDARSTGCRDQAAVAGANISFEFTIDADTAKRFLATCPGLGAGDAIDDAAHGSSIVWVNGTPDAISRVLAAPFTRRAEWSCQQHITLDRT